MLELTKSYTDDKKDRKVAAGFTIDQEGMALVQSVEDNVEAVKPCSGVSGELFVGFSFSKFYIPTSMVEFAEDSVPSDSPYTVQLAPYVIEGSVRCEYDNAGTWTPVVIDTGVTFDYTTGVATFTSTYAGKSVRFTYRRQLTAVESQARFGSTRINGAANDLFGQTTVMKGNGEVWTDQFDTTVDWSSATQAVLAANGTLGTASSVTDAAQTGATSTTVAGTVAGRIISRPSASEKFLGVAINIA